MSSMNSLHRASLSRLDRVTRSPPRRAKPPDRRLVRAVGFFVGWMIVMVVGAAVFMQ